MNGSNQMLDRDRKVRNAAQDFCVMGGPLLHWFRTLDTWWALDMYSVVHDMSCSNTWCAGPVCSMQYRLASFPGLPRSFCSSAVYVDNNTRMRKGGEKRGRPGIIHHASNVRWTRGGRRRGQGP